MMALNKLLFFVLLIGSYNFITATASKPVDEILDPFSSNLYQALAKDEGNILFSPFGLHLILSLVYQGAAGDTAKVMEKVLRLSNPGDVAEEYKKLLEELDSVENVTLNIANKVFWQLQYTLEEQFTLVAQSKFQAEMEGVDFVKNHEVAKLINDWVREKTKNKIDFNTNPTSFGSLTRLVLVNAVYFLGNWQHQFNPNLTRKSKFFVSEKDTVQCDIMNTIQKFRYRYDKYLDADITILPYNNTDLSLIIMLPGSRTGIKDLEKKLPGFSLTYLCRDLQETTLNIFLPRFKLKKNIDFNDSLSELGMGIIFDKSANFSNMIDSLEDIQVSRVLQKVFIEVNELGTEATTVKASDIKSTIKANALKFNVDHPFIFALAYNQSGTLLPLFVGRLSEP